MPSSPRERRTNKTMLGPTLRMSVKRFLLVFLTTVLTLLVLALVVALLFGPIVLGTIFFIGSQVALSIGVVRMLRYRGQGREFDEFDLVLVVAFYFGTILFFVWLAVEFELFWLVFIPAVPLAVLVMKYIELRRGSAGRV